MTDEEKKQAIGKQIEAFNRHDEKSFVEPIADKAKSVDIPTGDTFTGKDGARQTFQRWHQAFPDGKVTVKQQLISGDTLVLQFTGEGTQSGPLGPFPPSNKRARTEFISVNKFDSQGKIIETTMYYDQLSLLAQLGHLPIPAGAGARR